MQNKTTRQLLLSSISQDSILSFWTWGAVRVYAYFAFEIVQEVQGYTWEVQSLWILRGGRGGVGKSKNTEHLNELNWTSIWKLERLPRHSKWKGWYLILWTVNIHIKQNYLAFTESFLIINLGSNAKEHVSAFVWPQILPFSLWADDMPSLLTDIGC